MSPSPFALYQLRSTEPRSHQSGHVLRSRLSRGDFASRLSSARRAFPSQTPQEAPSFIVITLEEAALDTPGQVQHSRNPANTFQQDITISLGSPPPTSSIYAPYGDPQTSSAQLTRSPRPSRQAIIQVLLSTRRPLIQSFTGQAPANWPLHEKRSRTFPPHIKTVLLMEHCVQIESRPSGPLRLSQPSEWSM
jgi:hypothetical protein